MARASPGVYPAGPVSLATMPMPDAPPDESRVFAALLRHWRTRRGLSQLDLALHADVSARHVSYLETRRSRPSRDMVLRLAAALDVPLRDQNVMLREAGFAPAFAEPGLDALAPAVDYALTRLLAHHEPYPMLVLDRAYDVLRANRAAAALAALAVGAVPPRWNAVLALFAAGGVRRHLDNWEPVARQAVARLHRESLSAPQDARLRDLLDLVLELPDVPPDWRRPDFDAGSEGALTLAFRLGEQRATFTTTLMSFHAPQNVTLDELQIECYLPADDATEAFCRRALA